MWLPENPVKFKFRMPGVEPRLRAYVPAKMFTSTAPASVVTLVTTAIALAVLLVTFTVRVPLTVKLLGDVVYIVPVVPVSVKLPVPKEMERTLLPLLLNIPAVSVKL